MTGVLIGIPTHRRAILLRKCLESLAAQEGIPPSIRVFVADNDASNHEGVDIAEAMAGDFPFPLTASVVAEQGISAVRNAILDEARRCQAEFIAMIDDDETASPHWLAQLLKAQKAYGTDVVAGPVKYEFESGGFTRAAFWTDCRPGGPTSVIYATNNLLLSCAGLERMGWPKLDAGFGLTGGGDFEWFTRVRKLGGTFAWAADALVVETVPRERQSLRWFLLRQFKIGGNDLRVTRMHEGHAKVWTMLLISAGRLVLSPILLLVAPDTERRNDALRKWARAAGRIGELLGLRYREYASRHRPLDRSSG